MIAEALLESGHLCIPASTGNDAKRIIEAGLCRFDLLLSDVRMPGDVNGFQLAEFFRSTHPGAPVMMMSGHVDPELAESMSKTGYQVFVKPLRLSQIVGAVRAAFETAAAQSAGAAGDNTGDVVTLDPRKKTPPR
jgi:DNA-binding NtrC family response regulator